MLKARITAGTNMFGIRHYAGEYGHLFHHVSVKAPDLVDSFITHSHAHPRAHTHPRAGDVVYTVDAFLDKNRDTLTQDLLTLMEASATPLAALLFTGGWVCAPVCLLVSIECSAQQKQEPTSSTCCSDCPQMLYVLCLLQTSGPLRRGRSGPPPSARSSADR
jgi:hypothetical protein